VKVGKEIACESPNKTRLGFFLEKGIASLNGAPAQVIGIFSKK
jgi:hypothetical protein